MKIKVNRFVRLHAADGKLYEMVPGKQHDVPKVVYAYLKERGWLDGKSIVKKLSKRKSKKSEE